MVSLGIWCTPGIDFNQLISIVVPGWSNVFIVCSMTLCSYALLFCVCLGKGRMERTVPTTVILSHHQTRSIQTLR